MRAAALGAGACGLEYESRCKERVGLAVSFAERLNPVESASEPSSVSDDSGVRRHKLAKFSASCVREMCGEAGWFRRAGGCRYAIAQSGSDSVREDHGLK